MCIHIVDAATAARCRYSRPPSPTPDFPASPDAVTPPPMGNQSCFSFYNNLWSLLPPLLLLLLHLWQVKCVLKQCVESQMLALAACNAHTHTNRQTDSLSSARVHWHRRRLMKLSGLQQQRRTCNYNNRQRTLSVGHCGAIGRSGDRSDDSRMLIKASITGFTQAQSDASAGKTVPPSPLWESNWIVSAHNYIYTRQQINNRYVNL